MYANDFKEFFDKTPLEAADINIRHYNALRRKHIKTLGDVLRIVELGFENAFTSCNLAPRKFANLVYKLEVGGFLLYGSWHDLRVPSVAERLKWLAKQIQYRTSLNSEVDFMIAATLSFIRQGHTSTQGEYAPIVTQAMRWLENDRSLQEATETTLYGLLCVLGENYGMEGPPPSFEPPAEDDLKTLDQVHRYALLMGNAPIRPWEFKVYEDRPVHWHSNHAADFAWMTVGAPKPLSR